MYRKIILNIALLLSLTLCAFVIVFAADTDEPEDSSAVSAEEDYACAKNMVDTGFETISSYEEVLDEFFKVDVPSSEQLESAMTLYRATRDSINGIYLKSLQISGVKSLTIAADEAAVCTEKRDQYLKYIKVLLQRFLLGSASSKSTFQIVDGLKVMNEDLSDFSEVFYSTFPKVFNQMNNQMPCYARQCLTQ
jgi:hypothetical protein